MPELGTVWGEGEIARATGGQSWAIWAWAWSIWALRLRDLGVGGQIARGEAERLCRSMHLEVAGAPHSRRFLPKPELSLSRSLTVSLSLSLSPALVCSLEGSCRVPAVGLPLVWWKVRRSVQPGVLQTYANPLQDNPAYSVVTQYFVNADDTVAQKIVVHKGGPRGTHFRRAGPRQKVYFQSDEVRACIVTCGGLCPGLNTVIREIVCGLSDMYGVHRVQGIEGGYKGFYARNTIPLTPKSVNDIHKRGGTVLSTSRGGHDTLKIVDHIEDWGINQVYIIGGDGTQKGASLIFEEIRKRCLKVSVVGIPKTIDNDIEVIDKSFGFDTAVEEAQRAINAAHVEAGSFENGIGVVKLMGRHSGFIAMYATLASRDVDCCLIPESPFYLEGRGGLFEFIEKRLKDNSHMVLVVAEGAGQEFMTNSVQAMNKQDPSGNKQLLDVGLWLSEKIKEHFARKRKMVINLKYIDPTYMIRAIPSNASDNVYCTLLAHSAIHGAMAGYTGFTVGPVNGRHAYIPFYRVTEAQNKVVITDRMWARLLSSTNQPSFLCHKLVEESKKREPPSTQLSIDARCTESGINGGIPESGVGVACLSSTH